MKNILSVTVMAMAFAFPAYADENIVGVWHVQDITSAQGEYNLSELKPLTIEFKPDLTRVQGVSACNTYGAYILNASSEEFTLGPIMATQRGCMGANLDAVESDFFSALSSSTSYQVDNDLISFYDEIGNIILIAKKYP